MDFNEYQKKAFETATHPNIPYVTLALCKEAGEVAETTKLIIRGKCALEAIHANKDAMAEELGDALWYISVLATECGLTLEEVAERNLNKVKDRRKRKI